MAIIIGTRTSDTVVIGQTTSGINILSYNNVMQLDDIFEQTTFHSEWVNYKTTNMIDTNDPSTLARAIPLLSQATSNVDSHSFTGEKSHEDQSTAFPRKDLTCNGNPVSASTPDDVYISHAYYVISHIINPTDYTITTGGGTTQRAIKIVDADGTLVEFENPSNQIVVESRSVRFDEFDPHKQADRILRCYEIHATRSRLGGSTAFGTDQRSSFTDPDPFQRW